MQGKPLRLPVTGSAKTSRPTAGAYRRFFPASLFFLSFAFLFLIPAPGNGRGTVRIIGQKFDYREFRFDITVEASTPGVRLIAIRLYTRVAICDFVPMSNPPAVTVKSLADYRIPISWEEGDDTLNFQANPILEFSKNEKSRFTIGFITPPTKLLSKGCIQLTARPVLVFSDGVELLLQEEVIDSEDFMDYEKGLPTNEAVQQEVSSSDRLVKKNAARTLCKTTLPKTVLLPIIDRLIYDNDNAVRANAIISAGRLRYTEYTPLLGKRFAGTAHSGEAAACLRTLAKLDSAAVYALVTGRFDTSRMESMVRLCSGWLERNDFEKSSYQRVIDKLSGESPLGAKLACLPLVASWKIREAEDVLLNIVVSSTLDETEVSGISHTLTGIDKPSTGVKAYNLLRQRWQWLSQPRRKARCQALLQIIIDCDYQPALESIQELLQPGQPATTLDLTLEVFLRRRNNSVVWDRTRKALSGNQAKFFLEALKPSILILTGYRQEEVRQKAFKLYCYSFKPGDTPALESLIPTFLRSRSLSDQKAAVAIISDLNLKNLAPDLCGLLRETIDASLRSVIERTLRDPLQYQCN